MSPEEAAGATPSEASDWYGIGVTLYEALTGTIPFAGPVADVLAPQMTVRPARALRSWRRDVPCGSQRHLHGIARSPSRAAPDRPRGASRLTRVATPPAPDIQRHRSVTRHLSAAIATSGVERRLSAVTNSGAAAVSVYGPSGIGKSALVRRFLEPGRRTRRRRRAVRPLLRERVRALQGARWGDRRPESLSRIASTSAHRSSCYRRLAGIDASVSRVAAGARHRSTHAGRAS